MPSQTKLRIHSGGESILGVDADRMGRGAGVGMRRLKQRNVFLEIVLSMMIGAVVAGVMLLVIG